MKKNIAWGILIMLSIVCFLGGGENAFAKTAQRGDVDGFFFTVDGYSNDKNVTGEIYLVLPKENDLRGNHFDINLYKDSPRILQGEKYIESISYSVATDSVPNNDIKTLKMMTYKMINYDNGLINYRNPEEITVLRASIRFYKLEEGSVKNFV